MHDLVNDRSLTPPIDSNINEKNPRLIEDLQRENEQMTRLRQTQEWMRLQNLCIGGASVKSQAVGPPRQVLVNFNVVTVDRGVGGILGRPCLSPLLVGDLHVSNKTEF